MPSQKSNTRNAVLILMIIATTAMRFLSFKFPFMSNFTPIGAIAIFGGVYFSEKWKAYTTVLLTLFLSDVLINYLYTSQLVWFGNYTIWNCVCFALVVFIGSLLKKLDLTAGLVILFAPVFIHWLIMDLPWIQGNLYPHTFAGYAQSLKLAIPFEANMLLGDLLFGALLFGIFEFAKTKYTSLRPQRALAL